MANTLFIVRANITKAKEAAFNEWYNTDHLPKVLKSSGCTAARRFKKILGNDKYEYMAVYEFPSEEAFRRFETSDFLKKMIAEYNESFGDTSERERFAYVQVFP